MHENFRTTNYKSQILTIDIKSNLVLIDLVIDILIKKIIQNCKLTYTIYTGLL